MKIIKFRRLPGKGFGLGVIFSWDKFCGEEANAPEAAALDKLEGKS